MRMDRNSSLALDALRRVLRPLARLLLAQGVTLPAITELLKQVLVDVAEHEFATPGKKVTASRISVLTGVHRKDVRRLRGKPWSDVSTPESVSLGSRLVNTWISQPPWCDAHGAALTLARTSVDPDVPAFDRLAASVSTDVRPRAMLDELLRLGVVELVDGDQVQLLTEAFVPSEGVEEKFYYLAQAAYGHLSASVHNVQGGKPPLFDRIVHYNTIPAAKLKDLHQVIAKQGMRDLRAVNNAAQALADPQGESPQEITYGIYFFAEPATPKDDSQ